MSNFEFSLVGTLYIIFFFINYIYCKRLRHKSSSNEWSDVFYTLIFALTGIVGTCIFLVKELSNHFDKTDPPNWL